MNLHLCSHISLLRALLNPPGSSVIAHSGTRMAGRKFVRASNQRAVSPNVLLGRSHMRLIAPRISSCLVLFVRGRLFRGATFVATVAADAAAGAFLAKTRRVIRASFSRLALRPLRFWSVYIYTYTRATAFDTRASTEYRERNITGRPRYNDARQMTRE